MNKPQLVWLDKGKETFLDLNQYDFVPVEKYGPGDNKLYLGDNLVLLKYLLENKQKVDLIYIDPPFATNSRFFLKRSIGNNSYNDKKGVFKFPCYEDVWEKGINSYLSMLYERLKYMHSLLKETGSIYVHVDFRVSAYVRLILDEIFGEENFINEIIWLYKTGGVPEKIGFSKKHDTIFFYAKDKQNAYWCAQKEKSYLRHKYGFSNIKIEKDELGRFTWVNCRDVFDIPALRGNHPERLEYATQKPEELLQRIILASSKPGDIVADFFCGSGTTLAVAQKLERNWLGCDCGVWPINVCRKRLLTFKNPDFSLVKIEKKTKKDNAFLVKKNFLKGKNKKGREENIFNVREGKILEKVDLIAYFEAEKSIISTQKLEDKESSFLEIEWQIKEDKWALHLKKIKISSEKNSFFDIKEGKDWIDFWAVGFFKEEIFYPFWFSYRTRFKREISWTTPFFSKSKENLALKIITFEPKEFLFLLPNK